MSVSDGDGHGNGNGERELDRFYGPNAGYVLDLFERYRQDPAAVDAASRAAFAGWTPPATAAGPRRASEPDVSAAAATAALAQGIRLFGHLGAQLDPLGAPPPGDPQLDPATHGVSQQELARLPASVVGGPTGRNRHTAHASDAIARLRQLYCGTTGYEFAHVADPDERAWLLDAIETERFRPPADPIDEHELLDRLTEVSAFERFLHRAYPGQTRFSVEGLGMLIPMLDELLASAAAGGTRTILLGMAHRGRLNVLAHVLGKPYAHILAEFEGRVPGRGAPSESTDEGWTGDVKYHAGGRRAYHPDGRPAGTVAVVMVPNPSHLEFVDPVVQGMARAADEDRHRPGPPVQDESASLGVLIHGDASFPGQGIVAETLNLSRLAGYRTGGTLHIIANNQLGFTTEPSAARSTLYASDLAKGFEIPIAHVNADDPVACLAAMRLATAYRGQFHKDALIDLIGYRRWGHNEGDEPSFTQPRLYARIAEHPTVRERFAQELVRRGTVRDSEPEAFLRAGLDEFQRLRESVLRADARDGGGGGGGENMPTSVPLSEVEARLHAPLPSVPPPPTPRLSRERLRALNDALQAFPGGFQVNPKIERALGRRRAAFAQPGSPIDWGHAESLAFASLLTTDTPVRLTGQDSIRGTFSQRHLVFYDARTGEPFTPLLALRDASASFDVHNSPLSESAALGFEYGYSVQAPDTLVVWEAQYGDFVNGAQVIVDEFVVSGQAKWGLASGLVMLLPHAWEGQGPDHSSARLERFLGVAAEDNIRVANCTTAAQYFHLLRRQAASLRAGPRPLVVLTPKSLLRHPLAASPAADLAHGGFQPVLDDALVGHAPERVRRLAFCSGKIWADLVSDRRREDEDALDLAVVRLEELYPFPAEATAEILARYRGARDVIWLQEEPMNMGAWWFVKRNLEPLLGADRTLRYIGRPELASPAEGWAAVHAVEQRRILDEVLVAAATPAPVKRAVASRAAARGGQHHAG